MRELGWTEWNYIEYIIIYEGTWPLVPFLVVCGLCCELCLISGLLFFVVVCEEYVVRIACAVSISFVYRTLLTLALAYATLQWFWSPELQEE